MTDRIDAKDAYGDEVSLVRGAELLALESQAEKRGGVAGIWAWDSRSVVLTEDGAAQVASFLGRSVSPAACRDILAELAPLACSDDLSATARDFLLGNAPPHLHRITAGGLGSGMLVRSLIELGRALGRAEAKGEVSDGR